MATMPNPNQNQVTDNTNISGVQSGLSNISSGSGKRNAAALKDLSNSFSGWLKVYNGNKEKIEQEKIRSDVNAAASMFEQLHLEDVHSLNKNQNPDDLKDGQRYLGVSRSRRAQEIYKRFGIDPAGTNRRDKAIFSAIEQKKASLSKASLPWINQWQFESAELQSNETVNRESSDIRTKLADQGKGPVSIETNLQALSEAPLSLGLSQTDTKKRIRNNVFTGMVEGVDSLIQSSRHNMIIHAASGVAGTIGNLTGLGEKINKWGSVAEDFDEASIASHKINVEKSVGLWLKKFGKHLNPEDRRSIYKHVDEKFREFDTDNFVSQVKKAENKVVKKVNDSLVFGRNFAMQYSQRIFDPTKSDTENKRINALNILQFGKAAATGTETYFSRGKQGISKAYSSFNNLDKKAFGKAAQDAIDSALLFIQIPLDALGITRQLAPLALRTQIPQHELKEIILADPIKDNEEWRKIYDEDPEKFKKDFGRMIMIEERNGKMISRYTNVLYGLMDMGKTNRVIEYYKRRITGSLAQQNATLSRIKENDKNRRASNYNNYISKITGYNNISLSRLNQKSIYELAGAGHIDSSQASQLLTAVEKERSIREEMKSISKPVSRFSEANVSLIESMYRDVDDILKAAGVEGKSLQGIYKSQESKARIIQIYRNRIRNNYKDLLTSQKNGSLKGTVAENMEIVIKNITKEIDGKYISPYKGGPKYSIIPRNIKEFVDEARSKETPKTKRNTQSVGGPQYTNRSPQSVKNEISAYKDLDRYGMIKELYYLKDLKDRGINTEETRMKKRALLKMYRIKILGGDPNGSN